MKECDKQMRSSASSLLPLARASNTRCPHPAPSSARQARQRPGPSGGGANCSVPGARAGASIFIGKTRGWMILSAWPICDPAPGPCAPGHWGHAGGRVGGSTGANANEIGNANADADANAPWRTLAPGRLFIPKCKCLIEKVRTGLARLSGLPNWRQCGLASAPTPLRPTHLALDWRPATGRPAESRPSVMNLRAPKLSRRNLKTRPAARLRQTRAMRGPWSRPSA